MYEEFYHLDSDPFKMSPDHRFAFSHDSYSKARNYLEYGLVRGEGLVVITGLPGMGKSTVIEDLLSEHGGPDLEVARLQTTQLEVRELLRLVAYALGISAHNTDKATLLIRLADYLNKQYDAGRRVLLIIDEAQNLSQQALEELRLLTNIQREDGLHFQIFLLGQPQLQGLIRAPGMEQLRQRIVASCHFEPLGATDTQGYIEHRLKVAGWKGDPEITPDAIRFLQKYSGGIPRKINMLTSRLLVHGAVDRKHTLSAQEVRDVIAELPPEMLEQTRHAPRFAVTETDRPVAKSSAETVKKYERWQRAYRRPAATASNAAVALDAQRENPVAPAARACPDTPAGDTIPTLTDPVAPAARGAVVTPLPVDSETPAGIAPPRERETAPVPQRFEPAWPGLLSNTASAEDLEPDALDDLDQQETSPRRNRMAWLLGSLLTLLAAAYAASLWFDGDWRALLSQVPASGLERGPKPASVPATTPEKQPVGPTEPASSNRSALTTPPAQSDTEQTLNDSRVSFAPTSRERVTPPSESESLAPEPVIAGHPAAMAPEPPSIPEAVQPTAALTPQALPVAETPEISSPAAGTPNDAAATASPAGESKPATPEPLPDEPGISPALERSLSEAGFKTVPQAGGELKIELLDKISFASGQTRLSTGDRETLSRLAQLLMDHDDVRIMVIGHTDSRGDAGYNMVLSRQRAMQVGTYLIDLGVPAAHVRWEGRGEGEPLAEPAAGKDAFNRRIDLLLSPLS